MSTYLPRINWSQEWSQKKLLEQALISKVYISKERNKDEMWGDIAIILNTTQFLGFVPLKGPAYKQRFSTILKKVETKYALNVPGANLSGLEEEVESEVEQLAIHMLKEIADGKAEKEEMKRKKEAENGSMLRWERNVLGGNIIVQNGAGAVVNNVVNENGGGEMNGEDNGEERPARRRRTEVVDPFMAILQNFLKLETDKLQFQKEQFKAANPNAAI